VLLAELGLGLIPAEDQQRNNPNRRSKFNGNFYTEGTIRQPA